MHSLTYQTLLRIHRSILEIVAKDGSITYHNAITEAHPEAVQVSDRFHILKNLTDYASDVLKKELMSY
ncbi:MULTISPECIES: transposase [Bacillus cereus group]|uniref:transposase n=1 Tax=Bacillus cereus group TaxID=86661 RepID=UPI001F372131|nr:MULTISPECIES: transposase [Bacillus cereus group]MDM5258307.1 transposase [Bacillus toyonensis]MEC2391205.1 transposase [Bacillus toyonensis]